jgi:hypothetical protein
VRVSAAQQRQGTGGEEVAALHRGWWLMSLLHRIRVTQLPLFCIHTGTASLRT